MCEKLRTALFDLTLHSGNIYRKRGRGSLPDRIPSRNEGNLNAIISPLVMRQYSTYMPNEMGREIMNFYVRNGEYPGRPGSKVQMSTCELPGTPHSCP